MNRLKEAMALHIANNGPLPPHPLLGDRGGHREDHIGGDFSLHDALDDAGGHGLVVFVRNGAHAELFP